MPNSDDLVQIFSGHSVQEALTFPEDTVLCIIVLSNQQTPVATPILDGETHKEWKLRNRQWLKDQGTPIQADILEKIGRTDARVTSSSILTGTTIVIGTVATLRHLLQIFPETSLDISHCIPHRE